MSKKVPAKVNASIQVIKSELYKLGQQGYKLDFVEGTHCIVHWPSLGEEMQKPISQIDTKNYVISFL